ncbi:cellulase family glycosylhydrolase [Nocardioides sp. SYSU D00038]|uniref:cellulase family glycosylhydrolase n=1 Tax=Nocardioides sp. SYSU D00038 TaxID=2812554 RepID=UPI001967BA60|nr:cellulase family glycosylhydrolase [Nocardioides sp. SYSU D00038]
MRRALTALLALLVTAGVMTVTAGSADAAKPPPQLRREGRWLVDPQGRVVIVHGLNLVWKRPPYSPPNDASGFTRRDADWLRRHGFNAARVGTLWAGLTPTAPGRADPAYLRRTQRVLDLLAKRRIWVQLDMHQDQWHETYGGEGAPAWAMRRPVPYNLLPPIVAPFPLGYWTPEVSTVFDRFWANKDGLLDGWVAAWRVAARTWRKQPYLMGYDLLNEPWMGMEWAGCLTGGCPGSYRRELQPAMEKALAAIRAIDRRNLVWWEPQQFAGGQRVGTFYEKVPGESQLGFSWHSYCPDVFLESQGLPGGNAENCRAFAHDRQEHALEQSERMGAVPMMSEWGATDNLRAIEIDAEVADEHLMGWTHWAYKFWNDPTTADDKQGLFHDDRDLRTVKKDKVRLLVRTYAQAVAGIPTAMRFDARTGAFSLAYRPQRRIRAPTRIFVSPLHYPRGFRVSATHARTKRQGRFVLVRATSRRPVTVRIVAR